jgi:hypothetical protein
MGVFDQNGPCGDLMGVEWIQSAKDSDQWQDLLNSLMNLRILATKF